MTMRTDYQPSAEVTSMMEKTGWTKRWVSVTTSGVTSEIWSKGEASAVAITYNGLTRLFWETDSTRSDEVRMRRKYP